MVWLLVGNSVAAWRALPTEAADVEPSHITRSRGQDGEQAICGTGEAGSKTGWSVSTRTQQRERVHSARDDTYITLQ